ncbi:MAG: sugar transferase [Fuscovulum sp.]|nr:sugar transferase [Paracoccaceae bacterium]MCZ8082684.1 sugar transferase [Paracoccaceae bacterium]WRH63967.1 MAG: sugar transferase [Fuscovulum sp.]
MKLDDTFDMVGADIVAPASVYTGPVAKGRQRQRYLFARSFDILFALLAAPMVVAVALVLLVLNPIFNPGPLFFRQKRMGKDCTSFRMWKFRTMLPSSIDVRSHDAPLDRHRITQLGALLRKSRLDELPNLINVLRGEMALVGPRPDAWDHAVVYIRTIPLYAQRFAVLPGITGLAQVRSGYADDYKSVCRKARLDAIYVRNRSARMDTGIVFATVVVMLTGFGAR